MPKQPKGKTQRKPAMGRPAVEEPRAPRSIRATDGEWDTFKKAAQASGIGDLSSWARFVLLREARQLGAK